MNLEIHSPELVQRFYAEVESRHLHDGDELLRQALDALSEKSTRRPMRPAPWCSPRWKRGPVPTSISRHPACASTCGTLCSDGMAA